MTDKSVIAYEDLQFVPLAEDSPVQIARLWGNPETGPAAVMVRFPEDYEEPWHSHTSTYHSVLIKSEFQKKVKMETKSYLKYMAPDHMRCSLEVPFIQR